MKVMPVVIVLRINGKQGWLISAVAQPRLSR